MTSQRAISPTRPTTVNPVVSQPAAAQSVAAQQQYFAAQIQSLSPEELKTRQLELAADKLGFSNTGSQIFKVTVRDVSLEEPTYDLEITQLGNSDTQTSATNVTAGVTVPIPPVSGNVGVAFTTSSSNTQEQMCKGIVIKVTKSTPCSLKKSKLPLQDGITEEQHFAGDRYVDRGKLTVWFEIIITGAIHNIGNSKRTEINLSLSLFNNCLSPYFTRSSTSGSTTNSSTFNIQITGNARIENSGSLINLRTDTPENFLRDIDDNLWQPIQRGIENNTGGFTATNYRPFAMSYAKSQYEKLLTILREIVSNSSAQVIITPHSNAWIRATQREIEAKMQTIGHFSFYTSEEDGQHATASQAELELKQVAYKMLCPLMESKFVFLDTYYQIRIIGYRDLSLVPDTESHSLVYGKSNSHNLKIEACPAKFKNQQVPQENTQFFLRTDDGFYLSQQGLNIMLVNEPVPKCVWYLKMPQQQTCYHLHNAYTRHPIQVPSSQAHEVNHAELVTVNYPSRENFIAQLRLIPLDVQRWHDMLFELIGDEVPRSIPLIQQTTPAQTAANSGIQSINLVGPRNFMRNVLPGIAIGRERPAVVMVGVTGSGKSTLINHLLGHEFTAQYQTVGCNVIRLNAMPSNVTAYKGSYILTNNSELHYINHSGRKIACKVDIRPIQEMFSQDRASDRVYLSADTISNVILGSLPHGINRREFQQQGLSVKDKSTIFAGMAQSAGSGTIYPACYVSERILLIDAPGLKDTDHNKRSAQAFSMFLAKEIVKDLKVAVALKCEDFDRSTLTSLLDTLKELSEVFSNFEQAAPNVTFLVSAKGLTGQQNEADLDFSIISKIQDCIANLEIDTDPYKEFLKLSERSTAPEGQEARSRWHWNTVTTAVTAFLGLSDDDNVIQNMTKLQREHRQQFKRESDTVKEELRNKWNALHFLKLMIFEGDAKNVFAWGYNLTDGNVFNTRETVFNRLCHVDSNMDKGLLCFEQGSSDVGKFVNEVSGLVTGYSNQLNKIMAEISNINTRLNLSKDTLLSSALEMQSCLQELMIWDSTVDLEDIELVGSEDIAFYQLHRLWPPSKARQRLATSRFTKVDLNRAFRIHSGEFLGVQEAKTAFSVYNNSVSGGGSYQNYLQCGDVQFQRTGAWTGYKIIPPGTVIGKYQGRKKDQNPKESEVAIAILNNRIKNAKTLLKQSWYWLFGNYDDCDAFVQQINRTVKPTDNNHFSQVVNLNLNAVDSLLAGFLVRVILGFIKSTEKTVATDTDPKALITQLLEHIQVAPSPKNSERQQTSRQCLLASLEKYKTELAGLREHFASIYYEYYPLLHVLRKAQDRSAYLREKSILYDLEKFIQLCEQAYKFPKPDSVN